MEARRPRPAGRARRPSSNREKHESERVPQLTKEHGEHPYLRALRILRFLSNRCTFTSNAAAEGKRLCRRHLREHK